jgi:uncharacterized membrane protein
VQSAEPNATLSIRRIVITGILAAIAILLGVTRLGFIPVPNVSGNATVMHVPAIIGGVTEGPIVGLLIGLIFGVYSWLQDTTGIFKDPLVSVLPRLLIGVVAYYVYAALRSSNEYLALIVSAVFGTLTNTTLVLGMAIARGYIPVEIVPTILPQAIAELVFAAAITTAVVAAWRNVEGGRRGSSL